MPAPDARAVLGYEAHFDDSQTEQICEGLVPEAMEQKWFIFAESGWVYFHRSWTGVLIYAIKLDGTPSGVRVVESWVNRDPEQYTETDLDCDRELLESLIYGQLLHERR